MPQVRRTKSKKSRSKKETFEVGDVVVLERGVFSCCLSGARKPLSQWLNGEVASLKETYKAAHIHFLCQKDGNPNICLKFIRKATAKEARVYHFLKRVKQ